MTFSRPRLLIAEDDAIIAMDIEATFADLGFDVVVTTEVDQADVRLSTESWDCVILDGTLRNQSSTPLGKTCGQRRIPLVIYSGQADAELREAFPAAFIVAKPAVGDDLVTAVQMAMGKLG